MEQDSHKDIWDMLTTKTRMLVRHIQRSDGLIVEVERRMKNFAVEMERRNQDLAEIKDSVKDSQNSWAAWFSGLGQAVAERKAKKK